MTVTVGEFDLILVPVPHNRAAPDVHGPIPTVESASRIATVLEPFGATPVWCPDEPSESARGLRDWAREVLGSACRPVLLYWAGHGLWNPSAGDHGEHFLVTPDSGARPTADDSVTAAALGDVLADAWEAHGSDSSWWSAVIIDTCDSTYAVRRLYARLSNTPSAQRFDLLSAAAAGQSFSNVLASKLELVASRYGRNDSVCPARILNDLSAELGACERLQRGGPITTQLRNPSNPAGLDAVASTVDASRRVTELLQRLPVQMRAHFVAKAKGSELSDDSWFFEGRDAETNEFAAWLGRSSGGMFIVTGLAGAGKSAFVGRLVTLADGELVRALVDVGWLDDDRPANPFESAGGVDAAIHLTRRSLRDAANEVAAAVGAGTFEDVDSLLDSVRDVASRRRLTLVFDALDEATEPFGVAASLLRRLANIPNVCVVVGTRQSLRESPDNPEPTDSDLLNALAPRDGRDHTLKLTNDQEAVSRYVASRLRRNGYNEADASRIAEVVQSHNGPFLFARIAVTEIAARGLSHDSGDLSALLANGHAGLFTAALERLGKQHPSVPRVLETLAYGLGRGFPRADRVWLTAARSLYPTLDETDLDLTLHNAGSYLTEDGEFGQTTYRLAHRTFEEHFLSSESQRIP